MTPVDTVFNLLEAAGTKLYFGEAVTETEHALQSAALATAAGASQDLVAAALLHDIGHLLHDLGEDFADRGIDDRHETAGAAWLARHFRPEVVGPVRLHVAAKRYLCAVDPAYLAALSPVSQASLQLQGGPFDAAGVRAFEQEPHCVAALALRRWDDAAKVPGLAVPGLDAYRTCLTAALRPEARA